ncbi:hypothetical protein QJS04_geneDACA014409 [Acorus gramineus]|uniref:DUF630 domain-containing protein n=1 Tax=Acorus gramineus TaxID=55184 RepID=A0AAV9BM61_ACOGR|nr:hypothetical protein QJS04_geneDACA014409 [Acorus gramineus]
MCRDRRRLIRAAADLRYDFAAAHSSYFRSLPSVGSALHRFVIEELSISAASSSSSPPPPSPLPRPQIISSTRENPRSGHLDLSSEASSPAHQSSASPYEETYNGFSQVRFGGASSEISSPDSSEVRRREGIPNLEEEEEIVSDAHIDLGGSGESSSKVVDADVLEEKQRKSSSESRKSGSPATAGEEESVRKKGESRSRIILRFVHAADAKVEDVGEVVVDGDVEAKTEEGPGLSVGPVGRFLNG